MTLRTHVTFHVFQEPGPKDPPYLVDAVRPILDGEWRLVGVIGERVTVQVRREFCHHCMGQALVPSVEYRVMATWERVQGGVS